jgi:DNA ligase (NAD+)
MSPDIKKIVKKLHEAKDAYYNLEEIMSDDEYDKLEEQLRVLDPENSYFKKVGAKVVGKDKIKHKIPMLSTDKVKTKEEAEKWLEKINCKDILIEMKIDGLSQTCKYIDGKLQYLATRGDGHVGENKSYLSDYLKIPKTIDLMGEIEIRGEIVLFKDSFPSLRRNLAVGIVNKKEGFEEDAKKLKFITYQIVGSSFKTEIDKLKWLKNNGFIVVEYKLTNGIEEINDYYNEYNKKIRDDLKYDSDGMVLIVNNSLLHDKINSKYTIEKTNKYNLAWKPPSKSKVSVLKWIDWQVSRFGNLSPIAILDPVEIDGRIVTKASLSNYENVLRMKLEQGDELEVEVANDVIPYIKKNKTKDINQR